MPPFGNKSPCHQIGEADTIVVVRIFNKATMKKTIPPYHLTVAGEEEKINPQNQET
jgi:hypothetical protein